MQEQLSDADEDDDSKSTESEGGSNKEWLVLARPQCYFHCYLQMRASRRPKSAGPPFSNLHSLHASLSVFQCLREYCDLPNLHSLVI